jgi:soluble lytic murein transglycosylase-like protein
MKLSLALFLTLLLTLLLTTIQCTAAEAEAEQYPFSGCFDLASRRHNIDLDLLLAVASVESNWNPDARSSANAHGLMQIRWPVTARHLGTKRVAELYNPCLNIDLGARYLRELHEHYSQDTRLALAAYNYGPTRLKTHNDIPDSVQGYVNLVNRKRKKIAGEMNRSIQGNLKSNESVEIIRFNSASRARRYLASLKDQIPGLALNIKQTRRENIIYLDPDTLTPDSRYRLNSLVPDLNERLQTGGSN